MKTTFLLAPAVSMFLLLAAGCSDKKDLLAPERADNYVAAQSGKYIIYQTDSTVFNAGGTLLQVNSYQQKDVIDIAMTDAMGRPGYRVYRYLRDLAGTQPWRSVGTYTIVPSAGSVEIQENNLRSIKLAAPIQKGATWKGNRFLSFSPYEPIFGPDFSSDDEMNDWDFTYTATGETVNVLGKNYNNVVTVTQINDISVADTITVTGSQVTIPATAKKVWLRGNVSEVFTLLPQAPKAGSVLAIYNRTNFSAKLNNILVPPNKGRIFEYRNNQWTYGELNDTLYSDPPFGYKNYSVEQYAKGIGMITQDLLLWEYQPNPGGTPFTLGFGVRRRIIEHN